MNIIFLTMAGITTISQRGIYSDLLRKFRNEGHNVYIVAPRERLSGLKSGLDEVDRVIILGVKTLKLQKTNLIEKGIGLVLFEYQFKKAIMKEFDGIQFDLILYTTPPITFSKVIEYLKHNNPSAKSYLLLKDIFPQNAVDIGMMSKTGFKGLFYKFFRIKEKKLYTLSDNIGCMSTANVDYLLKHNPEIAPENVEVAPNSVELVCPYETNANNEAELTLRFKNERCFIRSKFNIPTDKPVFIYGGNLGKPQGIPFLMECLNANASRRDCFIVIVGTGTEFPKLKAWFRDTHPKSVMVLEGLPKAEYDEFIRACDVGMIFLDHRFTIPNFPSRLLSYLENKMPVICATDPNTDIGRIAEENGFGFWCESNSVVLFTAMLDKMIHSDLKTMGERGYEFLKKNYQVENTYNAIMRHV